MSDEYVICQMFIEKAELNLRKILSHFNDILVEELKTVYETTCLC